MVQRIITESGLPKALLARDSGLSRHTLHAWIVERTVPTPESIGQLAAGLESRADRLHQLAQELRSASETGGGSEDGR